MTTLDDFKNEMQRQLTEMSEMFLGELKGVNDKLDFLMLGKVAPHADDIAARATVAVQQNYLQQPVTPDGK